MTDYTELVNDLRTERPMRVGDTAVGCYTPTENELKAADAIDFLRAANEKLNAKLAAAREDMERVAEGGREMCYMCAHNNSAYSEKYCDQNTLCYGCNQFSWRGNIKS